MQQPDGNSDQVIGKWTWTWNGRDKRANNIDSGGTFSHGFTGSGVVEQVADTLWIEIKFRPVKKDSEHEGRSSKMWRRRPFYQPPGLRGVA